MLQQCGTEHPWKPKERITWAEKNSGWVSGGSNFMPRPEDISQRGVEIMRKSMAHLKK